MMQEMAVLTAQQGYGLDSAVPLLSIIRTGRNDFAAGALERLVAAEAVEVVAAFADGDDAVAIDRAFSAVALAGTPLAAVHCCGEEEGAALALALRLERVFVDLGIPVPPIVVHDGGSDMPGDTGMVRVAHTPNLTDARNYAALVDQRALAFHTAYLDGQRAARGSEFGTLPAERDWSVLSEQFRDDNRSSADHIDYKLARTGFVSGKRAGGAGLTEADIETLAALEHARWMARRSLAGWRYGPVRDNALLLHPDMKPYAELDEDAKRKDREQVALVPLQLVSRRRGADASQPIRIAVRRRSTTRRRPACRSAGQRSAFAADRGSGAGNPRRDLDRRGGICRAAAGRGIRRRRPGAGVCGSGSQAQGCRNSAPGVAYPDRARRNCGRGTCRKASAARRCRREAA